MPNGLVNRVFRLEQQVAERIEEARVCNCRVTTQFHNADCLEAVLKGVSRVCPRHGFRELGFFMEHPIWCPLKPRDSADSDDNKFCPCPPHPWRLYVLSGNHTQEASQAAREANQKLPSVDHSNFHEENRRIDALLEEYLNAQQKWVEAGGQLATKQELVKLHWKRAREHAKQ